MFSHVGQVQTPTSRFTHIHPRLNEVRPGGMEGHIPSNTAPFGIVVLPATNCPDSSPARALVLVLELPLAVPRLGEKAKG